MKLAIMGLILMTSVSAFAGPWQVSLGLQQRPFIDGTGAAYTGIKYFFDTDYEHEYPVGRFFGLGLIIDTKSDTYVSLTPMTIGTYNVTAGIDINLPVNKRSGPENDSRIGFSLNFNL